MLSEKSILVGLLRSIFALPSSTLSQKMCFRVGHPHFFNLKHEDVPRENATFETKCRKVVQILPKSFQSLPKPPQSLPNCSVPVKVFEPNLHLQLGVLAAKKIELACRRELDFFFKCLTDFKIALVVRRFDDLFNFLPYVTTC